MQASRRDIAKGNAISPSKKRTDAVVLTHLQSAVAACPTPATSLCDEACDTGARGVVDPLFARLSVCTAICAGVRRGVTRAASLPDSLVVFVVVVVVDAGIGVE